jgi:hypothetical protein
VVAGVSHGKEGEATLARSVEEEREKYDV